MSLFMDMHTIEANAMSIQLKDTLFRFNLRLYCVPDDDIDSAPGGFDEKFTLHEKELFFLITRMPSGPDVSTVVTKGLTLCIGATYN